jgi:hypothetical protein
VVDILPPTISPTILTIDGSGVHKVTNLPKLMPSARSTTSYIAYGRRYSYTKSRNSKNLIKDIIGGLIALRLFAMI